LQQEGFSAGFWVLKFEEGFGVEEVVTREEIVEAGQFGCHVRDLASVEVPEVGWHGGVSEQFGQGRESGGEFGVDPSEAFQVGSGGWDAKVDGDLDFVSCLVLAFE
jgi:hypothetical protein